MSEVQEDARMRFLRMEEPIRDCRDYGIIAATLGRAEQLELCREIVFELENKLIALHEQYHRDDNAGSFANE
jgi:hypothetical protein